MIFFVIEMLAVVALSIIALPIIGAALGLNGESIAVGVLLLPAFYVAVRYGV